MGKKRIIYLDLLRLIAAFFVICNHNSIFTYYQTTNSLLLYFISLFFSCLCKISVPLFFMISGALLLEKKESFHDYICKRLLKVVVMIFVFSFIQYGYFILTGREEFNFIDFFKTVYKSPITSSYWFLYIYLAFIITLPFLRRLVNGIEQKEFIFLCLIYVVFALCCPTIEIFFASSVNVKIRILETNIFFPVVGHYMVTHEFEWLKKKYSCMWLLVAGIIGVILSCTIVLVKFYVTGIYDDNSLSSFVVIPCISIFLLLKKVESHLYFKKKIEKWIGILGKATIGVYLIGNIVREVSEPLYNFQEKYMPYYISNTMYLFTQFTIGIIVTLLFQYVIKIISMKYIWKNNSRSCLQDKS